MSVDSYYTADAVSTYPERNLALALLVLARDDWPRLQVVTNDDDGYDVVIRVAGSYAHRKDAERLLDDYARQASTLLSTHTRRGQVPPT